MMLMLFKIRRRLKSYWIDWAQMSSDPFVTLNSYFWSIVQIINIRLAM